MATTVPKPTLEDRAALRPAPPLTRSPRRLGIQVAASIVGMALVIGIGALIAHNGPITREDIRLDQIATAHHDVVLTAAAWAINWAFGSVVAVIILILTAIVIAARSRDVRLAVTFFGAVAFPYLSSSLVKLLVNRPRPDPALLAHPLLHESDFSYPSGHTAFAASFLLALVLATRSARRRIVLSILGAGIVVATGASRIYLGVHYPIDVAASVVWSVSAMTFILGVWNRVALRGSRQLAGQSDREGASGSGEEPR